MKDLDLGGYVTLQKEHNHCIYFSVFNHLLSQIKDQQAVKAKH